MVVRPTGLNFAQRSNLQGEHFPAPMRGFNASLSLAQMQQDECIYNYNMIPSEEGMTVREGSEEWVNGFDSDPKTVIPFGGEEEADNVLFVVTNDGIYDATSSGSSPTQDVTFTTDTSSAAGFAQYTHFTASNGQVSLLVADSKNGMWEYDGDAGTWSQLDTSDITSGIDPDDVVFVMQHKLRMWLFAEGSQQGFYLPVDAKAGAATAFSFGTRFKHGGEIVGAWNWTIDGGDGVDDYMVVVSRNGDVVVYKGDDPSSASTWELVGVYYVGRIPAGRNIAAEYGGNLYLLTASGIVSMRELLQGVNAYESREVTSRINRVLRERMESELASTGWGMYSFPNKASFIVTTPSITDRGREQYVLNTNRLAWGIWRDLEIDSVAEYEGVFYFADSDDESFWVLSGNVDNVTLAGSAGDDIEWSLLTAYSGMRDPARFKKPEFVRARFIGAEAPNYKIQVLKDYDISEISGPAASVETTTAVWDTALWDEAIWGGQVSASSILRGQSRGWGQRIALALRGNSRAKTSFIDFDMLMQYGGFV